MRYGVDIILNFEGLKRTLLDMEKGDDVVCLWGIMSYSVQENGTYYKAYHHLPAMYITKEKRWGRNRYSFLPNFYFEGNELIRDACKKLHINTWGFVPTFDYETLIKVLIELPILWDKYVGKDNIFEYVSYDYNNCIEKKKVLNRPSEIKILKDKISKFEYIAKTIEKDKEKLSLLLAEEEKYRKVVNN